MVLSKRKVNRLSEKPFHCSEAYQKRNENGAIIKSIIISVDDVQLTAELNNTKSAEAIWASLPIEAEVDTWGHEIYCETSVLEKREPGARADMDIGDLGYWPVGHAFCIFFGPTPASTGLMPRAAGAVNVVGKINGDSTILKKIQEGAMIRIVPA